MDVISTLDRGGRIDNYNIGKAEIQSNSGKLKLISIRIL